MGASILAAIVACTAVAELAITNATLELSLRAIESFERGPVVLEVSITNHGTKPLFVEESGVGRGCWLSLPEAWNLERREREVCRVLWFGTNGIAKIRPGETYTERYYLSHNYRSPFPAGAHKIRTSWRLWTITKRAVGDDGVAREVSDRLAALPTKTFVVTITPATPANRLALARRLEAEFASLPPASPKDGDFESPFLKFCNHIIYAPHPELVPLYFNTLDRTPRTELFGRVAEDKLAESIFAADPTEAHRLFVDRLLAPKADFHSYSAFIMWGRPGGELLRLQNSFFAVLQPPFWFEPKWWPRWSFVEHLNWLARWTREDALRVLPDAELVRLATAKDFNVREWVFNHFRHRLSEEWRDAHLRARAQLRKNP